MAEEKPPHAGNWVKTYISNDRSLTKLEIILDYEKEKGSTSVWVTLDAEQLEEVIRLCQAARADMLPPPLER